MLSRVVAGLAILAVAVVSAVVSYQRIEDLSLSLHQTLLAARLMPVGIDGLITVGSVVLLQDGKLGWLAIVPGVAISLFANIESGIRYGALAAVWAGIPAVSFAIACFVLERWLTQQARLAGTPRGVTETDTVAATESETASASESAPGDAPESAPESAPEGASRDSGSPEPEALPGDTAGCRDRVREHALRVQGPVAQAHPARAAGRPGPG